MYRLSHPSIPLTSILLLASLLMLSCSSNPVGPVAPESVCGWAVGWSLDGYALILHTLDGGNNWERQGDAGTLPNVDLDAVRAVDSLHAWATGAESEGYATILSTSDAGATWTRMGQPGEIPDAELLTLYALDANRIWVAGSGNTILKTEDGGASWTSVSDPLYDAYYWEGIHVVDDLTAWVVGGETHDGMILHTTDGGGTWTAQGDSVLLTGYCPISITAWDRDHVFLVGGHDTVARSDNGGTDWELCGPPELPRVPDAFDVNGICQLDAERILICTDLGKTFVTIDWGDSWTQMNVPGVATGYFLLRICALDAQTAWSAGNGVEPGILVTMTDGFNWSVQSLPTGSRMDDVSFAGSVH